MPIQGRASSLLAGLSLMPENHVSMAGETPADDKSVRNKAFLLNHNGSERAYVLPLVKYMDQS